MWGRQKRYFTYYDRKRAQRRGRRLVSTVILLFLVYQLVVSLLAAPIRIGNPSMEPAFPSRSSLVYSPLVYGAPQPFSDKKLPALAEPGRGDVVVVRNPGFERRNVFYRGINRIVLFFTFQRLDLRRIGRRPWEKPFSVKRVVAVPGDTLRMEDFLVRIKPEGEDFFLTEYEHSSRDYRIRFPRLDDSWHEDLPFTGHREPLRLEEGEYYLLGDNRGLSRDSRSWGPVSRDQLMGKVLFSYWPWR